MKYIHRALGRLIGGLTQEEVDALGESGAKVWSKWIDTTWSAAMLGYLATWTDIGLDRLVPIAKDAWRRWREKSVMDKASKANGEQPTRSGPIPGASDLPRDGGSTFFPKGGLT